MYCGFFIIVVGLLFFVKSMIFEDDCNDCFECKVFECLIPCMLVVLLHPKLDRGRCISIELKS